MTDNEMRLAIAGACPDWEVHHCGKYCAIPNHRGPLSDILFDPLDDLNAMHEAAMFLRENDQDAYHKYLSWITPDSPARERAVAFLKAKGLLK